MQAMRFDLAILKALPHLHRAEPNKLQRVSGGGEDRLYQLQYPIQNAHCGLKVIDKRHADYLLL